MSGIRFLIVLVLAVIASPAWAGSIIKCQSADGAITYSDSRCPAGYQQVSKKTYQQRRLQADTSIKNLESAAEYPADSSESTLPPLVFQSRFAQALSASSAIKVSMMEYYLYHGKWPESLEAMGLDSRRMTSSQIDATEIAEQGRIRFKLSRDFGDNKEIWLSPTEVMGGTQIEWRCFSNFPAALLSSAAGIKLCTSRYF